jgi:hypothetical protein
MSLEDVNCPKCGGPSTGLHYGGCPRQYDRMYVEHPLKGRWLDRADHDQRDHHEATHRLWIAEKELVAQLPTPTVGTLVRVSIPKGGLPSDVPEDALFHITAVTRQNTLGSWCQVSLRIVPRHDSLYEDSMPDDQNAAAGMRVRIHETNEITARNLVLAKDPKLSEEDTPGGAPIEYTIIYDGEDDGVANIPPSVTIRFQNGPVAEGINGVFMETLVGICIDRLQCFQKGPFKNRENALMITKLEEALHWSQHRSESRRRRGVLGDVTP